jgi:hypothetical protein
MPWREERAEFVLPAVEVGFNGAERTKQHRCDFGMGEALLKVEVEDGAFVGIQHAECDSEVVLQVARARW